MSTTENKGQVNFIGNAFFNEYEGEFTGCSIYLTAEDLENAKEYLGSTGRLSIQVKKGRESGKPYASIKNAPAFSKEAYTGPKGNSGYSRVTPTTTLEF
jgi:hypothetical protein